MASQNTSWGLLSRICRALPTRNPFLNLNLKLLRFFMARSRPLNVLSLYPSCDQALYVINDWIPHLFHEPGFGKEQEYTIHRLKYKKSNDNRARHESLWIQICHPDYREIVIKAHRTTNTQANDGSMDDSSPQAVRGPP